MDERKELIELLKSGGVRNFPFVAVLADYLIKNGVTVRQSLSIKVTGGEIEPVITNANKIPAAEVEPVKWLPIVGYSEHEVWNKGRQNCGAHMDAPRTAEGVIMND